MNRDSQTSISSTQSFARRSTSSSHSSEPSIARGWPAVIAVTQENFTSGLLFKKYIDDSGPRFNIGINPKGFNYDACLKGVNGKDLVVDDAGGGFKLNRGFAGLCEEDGHCHYVYLDGPHLGNSKIFNPARGLYPTAAQWQRHQANARSVRASFGVPSYAASPASRASRTSVNTSASSRSSSPHGGNPQQVIDARRKSFRSAPGQAGQPGLSNLNNLVTAMSVSQTRQGSHRSSLNPAVRVNALPLPSRRLRGILASTAKKLVGRK